MIDCPHVEDIYDMSTKQLQELQQILRRSEGENASLLETVLIELEERKTLDFFTQFCQIENPYTKKIAEYNNEFLKLAEQAVKLNKSSSQPKLKEKQLTAKHPPSEDKLLSYKMPKMEKNATTLGNTETDNESRTHQSEIAHRIENMSMKSNSRDSQRTENFSQLSVDKKMNLGGKTKKKKNKMKQMMEEMLAKTKVSGGVVIGRAAGSSPLRSEPQKKFHIPGERHENLHTKTSTIIHKKEQKDSKTEKKVQKPSQQELIRRRKQLSEKVQTTKKANIKLPKVPNNNNKKFVEMVKKEEQERKSKTQKLIPSKKQIILPTIQPQKEEDEVVVEEIENNEEYNSCKIDEKRHSESEKQIIEDIIRQEDIIAQQQIEESLSQGKLDVRMKMNQLKKEQDEKKKQVQEFKQENEKVKQENKEKVEEIPEKQVKKVEKNQQKKEEQIVKKQQQIRQRPIQEQKEEKSEQIQKVDSQVINQKPKEQQKQVDYAAKLIKQIEQEQNQKYYFFNSNKKSQKEEYEDEKESVKAIEENTDHKEENKNCYNEEYWTHIREEAELKIRRFRQEKQIEQREKQKISEEMNHATQSEIQVEQPEIKEQDQIEKQIKERQEQFKKMKNIVMRKTGMKKKAEPKPAPQKVLRPKPQFDYLSIYPSFNHIFSIMYLKSAHQATLDIPIIMKDLRNLFSSHIEHFKQKSNFQPALFLPFDHHNSQFSDPKQLILNAENTYVDLKVMIERTEIFNGNLHGQFSTNENLYYRVIKSKQQVYDIITTSFLRRKGWKQLPHGYGLKSSWNLFWSWSKPDIDLGKLLVWQRINHFPFNKNLSRKDLLYRNLEHFKKAYRVSMNFLPLTFNLPKDFTQFSIKFHEEEISNKDHNYWIMKPIGKSRGRGIKVIGSISQLNYVDNIVVQKYISNPLLLDGYKFDMRIYVLVTSFHPLEAFVYKEGFARLSTEKYSLDPQSIKNAFMHLTNFSINKNNTEAKEQFSGGSKISLKNLKQKVTKMGYSFSNIWTQVHEIIIKSLLGCSISVPSFPTAFELFGYDIMVDRDSQCHLIEINSSPSLERSYLIDEIVKQSLIDDIFDIINPPNFDKTEFLDVISQRLQMMQSRKKITAEDDLIGLARILRYKPVRCIGEKPQKMGLFEMVAPSQTSRQLEKLIKSKSGANNPQNID